jgi:hypothetical protein
LKCENPGDTTIQLLSLNGVALDEKKVSSFFEDNTFTIWNIFEREIYNRKEEKYFPEEYLFARYWFDVVLEVSCLIEMKLSSNFKY